MICYGFSMVFVETVKLQAVEGCLMPGVFSYTT
jgi:hypothetical protein